MKQRLNSDEVLDIVGKHKESVEGYVRRHDLDIYQINKLIKAETSIKDRNSVLNFLRKEKEKVMQKEPREKALKQDLREEHINRKTGRNTLNDLKDDIIDIRQQVTEINTDAVDPNLKKRGGEFNESKKTPETEDKGSSREKTGSYDSEEEKSLQTMKEEVDQYFDRLPSDRDESGIVSSFRNLLSQEEDVSEVVEDLEPFNIFEDIKDKSDRERAFKAAYTVKKCLENKRNEKLSYGEISSMTRNGELPVGSDAMAEMFNYLNEYNYSQDFNFEDVDQAVSNCQALVHRTT